MEHTGEGRRVTEREGEGLTGPYSGSNATDERQHQQDKEEKDHLTTVNRKEER